MPQNFTDDDGWDNGRQQAIIWANADQDLYRHMAPLDYNTWMYTTGIAHIGTTELGKRVTANKRAASYDVAISAVSDSRGKTGNESLNIIMSSEQADLNTAWFTRFMVNSRCNVVIAMITPVE